MTHLDTNFLIQGLVLGSPAHTRLRAWVRDGHVLAISAPAWAEFLCGPVGADDVAIAAEILGRALPFEAVHAPTAAALFNAAGRRRGVFTDCLIAAIAIAAGAELVTANVDDFGRFVPLGLRLVT